MTPRAWVDASQAKVVGDLSHPDGLGEYAVMRFSSGPSGTTGDVMWAQGSSTYDLAVYSSQGSPVSAEQVIGLAKLLAAKL